MNFVVNDENADVENELYSIYHIDNNNEIFLINASEKYLRMRKFYYNAIGKNIKDFEVPKVADEIERYFHLAKEGKRHFEMFYEFEVASEKMIYHITVKSDNNLMKITHHQIDMMHNPEQLYENTLYNHTIGAGIVDCCDRNHIRLISSNSYLKILTQTIPFDYFCQSYAFRKTYDLKISFCSSCVFKNEQNISVPYVISTVPYISSENIEKIFITIIPDNFTHQINYDALNILTKREAEIAQLATKGYTNRYISSKLNISEGTVKKTLYHCYQKLDVGSRVEMIERIYNQHI